MPEADGLFHAPKGLIDIRQGQLPVDTIDAVVHEVLHAVLFCQGRENGGDTEELYVRALATGLVAALKDNPEFTEWLTSSLKNTP